MAEKSKATQEFVPVREVRDGIAILKDGSMRAILMASSLNFALKSADEQESILFQFQNFLNSLDFSVQFFIQSRELDIRPYINLLEERYKAQTDDLMRIQVREYIDFIKNFMENADIMSKSFFVVVPYTPTVLASREDAKGVVDKLLGKKSGDANERSGRAFEENRSQLEQRVAVVEQGLTRTGVRMVQLGTEEVIELLYKLFNPGELEKPISLAQNT
jgi:hypothetical protein